MFENIFLYSIYSVAVKSIIVGYGLLKWFGGIYGPQSLVQEIYLKEQSKFQENWL